MGILVFISVLLVAACGLIYELVAGTLASYLVGDSVFQFSTIIGTYLFAMGLGSALSRARKRTTYAGVPQKPLRERSAIASLSL